ncbi:MAG: hypothetical protein BTN85_0846 [Candidatus Methanohalarchaeum thermophilum]|uniref:Uncharacterized protein n=1 Tax=Methanohalarchaeum thermophilum TaxID=1903181 RepID=A0A1Q6DVH9_METT1|nr:MAG: hypothetical protein BTN85_0846 [Candidatus Methanohalarchaeum thermophilum]
MGFLDKILGSKKNVDVAEIKYLEGTLNDLEDLGYNKLVKATRKLADEKDTEVGKMIYYLFEEVEGDIKSYLDELGDKKDLKKEEIIRDLVFNSLNQEELKKIGFSREELRKEVDELTDKGEKLSEEDIKELRNKTMEEFGTRIDEEE